MKGLSGELKALMKLAYMGVVVALVFTVAMFIIAFGILCGFQLADATVEWMFR